MEILNGGKHKRDGRAEGDRSNAAHALHVQKYLPIAVLYFFLNSAGLPTGCFIRYFVTLFFSGCPARKRWITVKFLACLIAFRRGARNHWN